MGKQVNLTKRKTEGEAHILHWNETQKGSH